jgi:hypothetical protein
MLRPVRLAQGLTTFAIAFILVRDFVDGQRIEREATV